jgi:capsular polysaccharide biosynthesis protein
MENINIKEVTTFLLRKLWLILAILAVVVAGGEIYSNILKTPLYESNTNVVLISDNSTKTEITNNDVTLSNNLVKTYSEIVKSRNVLSKVIENLHLDESYESLKGQVTVSSVTSTQLISIKISDKDPKKAKEIADELGKVFKAEIKEIYKIDNVQIVDEAAEANSPYNINIVKESIIYLVAGLVLGVGAAYLLFIMDKTIKDTDTVEKKLGLTVMGVVPEVESK